VAMQQASRAKQCQVLSTKEHLEAGDESGSAATGPVCSQASCTRCCWTMETNAESTEHPADPFQLVVLSPWHILSLGQAQQMAQTSRWQT